MSKVVSWIAYIGFSIASIMCLTGLVLLLTTSDRCRQAIVENRETFACQLNEGWYIFFGVSFSLILAFSVYMMYRQRYGDPDRIL